MNTTEAGILIVAIFALVAIFAFVRFRKNAKVQIDGPLNTKLNLAAENDPPAGLRAHKLKARGGDVAVHNDTGSTTDVEDVESAGGVNIQSRAPNPKA